MWKHLNYVRVRVHDSDLHRNVITVSAGLLYKIVFFIVLFILSLLLSSVFNFLISCRPQFDGKYDGRWRDADIVSAAARGRQGLVGRCGRTRSVLERGLMGDATPLFISYAPVSECTARFSEHRALQYT